MIKKFFQNKTAVSVLCTAVLLIGLYAVIPMTIDDWSWGGSAGINRLSNFFDGYNGRYLGNLFVLAFTRSAVARVVLMTAGSVWLCYSVYRYALGGKTSVACYWLAFLMIFSSFFSGLIHEKLNLFSQTLAWCSGYANYVIPTALLVVYMGAVDRDFRCSLDGTQTRDSAARCIAMALLGFCTCLFLENMTLFCFGLSFGVLFYFFFLHGRIFKKKTKKLYASHATYCVGTLAGTVTMFTNSSYNLIAKGTYTGDDATTINDTSFRKIGIIGLEGLSETLSKLGLSTSVLPLVIAALLAAVIVLLLLPVFATKDKGQRLRLYSLLLFTGLITVPLLFANGAHPYLFTLRLYFPQFVLLVCYLMQIILLLVRNKPRALKKCGKVLIAVMLCVLIAANVYIYAGIHRIDRINESLIAQQLEDGEEVIRVVSYPSPEKRFVFAANAFEIPGWAPRYKDYYGIDESKTLKPISYKTYLQQTEE